MIGAYIALAATRAAMFRPKDAKLRIKAVRRWKAKWEVK